MPWQATLGATDVQTGRNSYYKIQLLEDDNINEYVLFGGFCLFKLCFADIISFAPGAV